MTRPLAVATTILALALTGCARPQTAAVSASVRPGLGTSWGETRESAARPVVFEREDPSQPDVIALLHYDDRAGLRAAERGFTDGPGDAWERALGVRLLDARGVPLPQFQREGRRWVEGLDGERYTIEIENRSDGRIEVVASVDGLDVMDGEPGSLDKRGYVMGPAATLRIEGFRRSASEVAAFRFGAVSESYAAQKGDDTNVGVIGVACFGERGSARRARAEEAERRRHAGAFPREFARPPLPRPW
jgi:hypothetical protein